MDAQLSICKHRGIVFVLTYFACTTVSRRQCMFGATQTVRGNTQKTFKARESCEAVNTAVLIRI